MSVMGSIALIRSPVRFLGELQDVSEYLQVRCWVIETQVVVDPRAY
jgi:hypothetical protein